MTRPCALLAALAVVVACRNPSSPNAIDQGSLPSGGGVVNGRTVAQQDGDIVAGASLSMGAAATVSNAAGEFIMSGTAETGIGTLLASAPGYVQRGVTVNLSPARAGILVDLIRDAPPFDLFFYRSWARDSLSLTMQPLRPWTRNPNFYFKTTTDDDGVVVPDAIIDRIVTIFTNSIPELSGSRRQIGLVERGPDTRAEQEGWVVVNFFSVLSTLGFSTIGGDMGTITLQYAPALLSTPQNNPFSCDEVVFAIADHEITHTMGYYHTLDIVLDSFSPGCSGGGRSERTRFHSALMYSRPPGNRDPDLDPNAAAQSQSPVQGPRRRIPFPQ